MKKKVHVLYCHLQFFFERQKKNNDKFIKVFAGKKNQLTILEADDFFIFITDLCSKYFIYKLL